MRTLLVIAVVSVLMSPFGMAQAGRGGGGGGRGGGRGQQPAAPPPPPDPGFECFDSLEIPEFPAAALQAHVDGTVWTRIKVTPQAAVDTIDSQVVSAWSQGSKLLTPPVEKAIRASKIKSTCAGKEVAIVYRYQLYGEPTAAPKPTNRKENPNIVWIESQPETKPATSAKK